MEDYAEFGLDVGGGLGEAGGVAEKLAEGSDGLVGDAARDDVLEVGHVGVDVEGEAMAGDPMVETDPDGGDLGSSHPDAGVSGEAFTLETVVGEDADDHFFEGAQVPAHGALPLGEVEDGVGDELSGAVAGDIAAAVGLDDLDAAPGIFFAGQKEVFGVGGASESDDWGVFEEEEGIGGDALLDGALALVLACEHVGVGYGGGDAFGFDDRIHGARFPG